MSLRAERAHKIPKPYYFERIFEAFEDVWCAQCSAGCTFARRFQPLYTNGVSA